MKLRKQIGLLMMLLGGSFAITVLNNSSITANAKTLQVASQDEKTEQVWAQRMAQFAATRQQYHYPSISWNTRDLGGYQAGKGYHIKVGQIYRSSLLNGIDQQGANQLAALHINKVIDLRTKTGKGGIAELPDPNELTSNQQPNLGVHYYFYPTNSAAQRNHNRKLKQKYGQIYTYGRPFTTYASARKSYHQVLMLALHNQNGAILYHCLAGRDRTGTTSIVLLSALGVNKRTIYNDYMLTDYYRHKYSYAVQKREIDRFYQTIKHYYGNMNNYLRKGIGLTDNQKALLRAKYLVKD